MKEPKFWKRRKLKAILTLPLSMAYFMLLVIYNIFSIRGKSKLPVICIGNANVGGVGKTPIAIEVGKMLTKKGIKFAYLSRGYKRDTRGLIKINNNHISDEVGDEPLLLRNIADAFVCENRLAGAKAIESDPKKYEAIIMDDGLQNTSLKKNVSILVVSGMYGFGNRFLFPAGPIREPLRFSLRKADCVILMGKDRKHVEEQIRKINKKIPIIYGRVSAKSPALLSNKNVFAFAGISHPKRFFQTLEDLEYNIEELEIFDDHYQYNEQEIEKMLFIAKEKKLKMITTEKDWVRLPEKYKKIITPLKIDVTLSDPKKLSDVIDKAFK